MPVLQLLHIHSNSYVPLCVIHAQSGPVDPLIASWNTCQAWICQTNPCHIQPFAQHDLELTTNNEIVTYIATIMHLDKCLNY